MTTADTLKEIKRSFRPMMNGVASTSMRDKGMGYKLNWGVPLPTLREMAEPYAGDFHLALALWKEDIRECRIMALLIMPPAEMTPDLMALWAETLPTTELAEMLASLLAIRMSYAPQLAFEWMAAADMLRQVAGFQLAAALFARKTEPTQRAAEEFVDHARAALADCDMAVKHAAWNALLKFADMGEAYEQMAGI